MRLHFALPIVLFLGLPATGGAQEAVPIHLEPRHRPVLDSVRFRVLDVRIPPGDTTRFHVHDAAILYVSLLRSATSGQVLGGEWPPTPTAPSWAFVGEVAVDSGYVREPVTHRVANSGDGLFRLLAIVSSGPARGSREEPQGLPGTVELRSTWFRQSRVEVPAGVTTEWSESASPVLVVQPFASRLAVERAGGARHALPDAGSWFLVPAGVRYRLVNEGTAAAGAVAVQIR